MDKIASPKKTREIIEQYQFKFSKSLGQNFLIDKNILEKIVEGAGVTKEDNVIEVGPGIGSLTQHIAEKGKSVVAIEIDKSLLPILKDTLQSYDNVEVIHEDVLKLDIHSLIHQKFHGKKVKVIANLPYYVTTPIVMKFLEEKVPLTSMTIMIQQEVAKRMEAQPSTKDYGALSIAVQYYCQPKILLKVPPSVFIPQPKVDSTVIRLDVLEKPKVYVEDEMFFFSLVKDAFGKRRKTLLNALSTGILAINKELVKEVLQEVGIEEKRRGETLTIEEFAALSNSFSARG
ncbi:16S rRNA (adenine(1518)-N(6)/adenine(1519)-N(6))-dimethyltransferase RsmA [Clostridium formicaceticum]|uniref:Ribosomal RNA small subunit methyltransferase A n=1 Tax=Clostridium formicaceticum TaxID=1497 RepID=A0AAC9RHA9_9CLOT|nr:16S rRNA (adenine(1518)-N(6)/adenine(1519)-N(6))-dimethyltransferase RsmA [Clostridium formicaceticum]AOY75490.1 16S rRNA (adenine(1518)-N(6)/adenine(1519)-N(6))-dimethyltransferase [Clostridium formicaceticum]ARE85777.1 Ribosomal RNA small subunit methyltransferase A [Clostridium formicaceticum]